MAVVQWIWEEREKQRGENGRERERLKFQNWNPKENRTKLEIIIIFSK